MDFEINSKGHLIVRYNGLKLFRLKVDEVTELKKLLHQHSIEQEHERYEREVSQPLVDAGETIPGYEGTTFSEEDLDVRDHNPVPESSDPEDSPDPTPRF